MPELNLYISTLRTQSFNQRPQVARSFSSDRGCTERVYMNCQKSNRNILDSFISEMYSISPSQIADTRAYRFLTVKVCLQNMHRIPLERYSVEVYRQIWRYICLPKNHYFLLTRLLGWEGYGECSVATS